MISFIRTDSDNEIFRSLVKMLDHELAIRDGADHAFYSRFNKIDNIRYAVIGIHDSKPVACGAIKEFSAEAMEVKRMFVVPENRSRGFASQVLAELERWAKELGYKKCVLETGKRQPEAIALYEKNGYRQIANYGQYIGIDNSVCFEKIL